VPASPLDLLTFASAADIDGFARLRHDGTSIARRHSEQCVHLL